MMWTITPRTIEIANYPVVRPCQAFKSTKRQASPPKLILQNCEGGVECCKELMSYAYIQTTEIWTWEAEPPGERSTISPAL